MTKAERVRAKRLKTLQAANEIEKIFDWILDKMDEDTDNGVFESREFVLFKDDDEPKLMTYNLSDKYDLSKIFSTINREIVFNLLNKLINEKDGYKSEINFDAKHNHYDAISIIVSIIE